MLLVRRRKEEAKVLGKKVAGGALAAVLMATGTSLVTAAPAEAATAKYACEAEVHLDLGRPEATSSCKKSGSGKKVSKHRVMGARRRPWAGRPARGAVDALRAVEEAGAEVDREVRVQQLHPVPERADEGLTAGPAHGRGRRTRGGAAAPAVFSG